MEATIVLPNLERLAEAVIEDPNGGRRKLGDLWSKGTAVIYFLRQFG